MSTFDPASLLETTVDAANDTKVIPVPEGEYLAVIDNTKISSWQSKDGASSGLRLDVEYLIDDAAAKEATGLNAPGQPFAMQMLPGRLVKIKVTQRPSDKDPETIYNDVRGVTKAG